jgi:hypothetical protein
LANLGNVYRQGQQQAAQQQTLAQLGNDPNANAQLLIKSGVPELVTQGIRMQSTQTERAENIREFNLQQNLAQAKDKREAAAEARRQGDWEKADADEKAAADIISRLYPAGSSQQAPQQPAPPSPFPNPVTAPKGPSIMAQGPEVEPASLSDRLAAVGGLAGGAVPGNLPPSLAPIAAAPAAASLQTPQVASGAISREDLAAMARNPLTRPLALDYLKKQVEDQKPIAAKEGERFYRPDPNRPGQLMDVTPGGAQTKEQVVNDAREKWALEHNYTPQQASYYGATGKFPKDEELRPGEQTRVNKLTDEAEVADRVLSNISQARTLSKTAYGFSGAGPVSLGVATAGSLLGLPKGLTQGAVDTQDLINAAHNNVVQVARSYFPQRVTNIDLNLTKDLEGTANQPDSVRQKVYDRAEKVFGQIAREKRDEADAIRNKTFYKPGGGQLPPSQAAPPPGGTPAPAASGAKPTLQEFMVKARAANPGAKDSELAQFWKQKYGG